MKYCGCHSCQNNGERNLIQEFEDYCAQREESEWKEFEDIFLASYTLEEMVDLYAELCHQFDKKYDIVEQIN